MTVMEKEDKQNIAAMSTPKGGATQIVLPKMKFSGQFGCAVG
jgi:hypothetical protein